MYINSIHWKTLNFVLFLHMLLKSGIIWMRIGHMNIIMKWYLFFWILVLNSDGDKWNTFLVIL